MTLADMNSTEFGFIEIQSMELSPSLQLHCPLDIMKASNIGEHIIIKVIYILTVSCRKRSYLFYIEDNQDDLIPPDSKRP